MTIDKTNLDNQIQTCLDSVTTCDTYEDLLLLSKIVADRDNFCSSVACDCDLPSASTGCIPDGQSMFVDSIKVPVYKYDQGWYGFDGREYRYDGPIRTLWTWGLNLGGRLGDGTIICRSLPITTVDGGKNWCVIAVGENCGHSLAIKTDGTLWTWGCNSGGRLGDNTIINRSSPGTTAAGGTDWCAVARGPFHSLALKTDGTLWTWGINSCGPLGDGTIANRSSPVTTAAGGTDWCAVAGGGNHSLAIKTDGTLWTWGLNNFGQLGDGTVINRSSPGTTATGGTDWCAVASGSTYSIALKTDGTLWTWGRNDQGQLGDGTIICRSSPITTAAGGTDWCAISTGGYHSLAIKTDGTLWTWGFNFKGGLGDGTTTVRSSPVTTVAGGTDWYAVSGGVFHSLALKTDGTLWSWGDNCHGQLGDGTRTDRSSPGTILAGGTDWCAVSAGQGYSLAIKFTPAS